MSLPAFHENFHIEWAYHGCVLPTNHAGKHPGSRREPTERAARKLQRQAVVLPPKKPPIPNSTEAIVLPPKKPRHLSLRRGGCPVAGPKHRHRDVFHAEIGHRT